LAGHRTSDWSQALLATTRAKKALAQYQAGNRRLKAPPGVVASKARPSKTTSGNKGDVSVIYPTHDLSDVGRAEKALFALFDAQSKVVARLAHEGHWEEARQKCLAMRSYFMGAQTFACHLADIDFRLGKYQEAYDALIPLDLPHQSEGPLLRLSVAAAHLGQVLPGQREYVGGLVGYAHVDQDLKREFAPFLPDEKNQSPKAVEFLSYLSLSQVARSDDFLNLGDEDFFLRQALAIDPDNVAAHYLRMTEEPPRMDAAPSVIARWRQIRNSEAAFLQGKVPPGGQMAYALAGGLGTKHTLPTIPRRPSQP
jgi:hypothetical protein